MLRGDGGRGRHGGIRAHLLVLYSVHHRILHPGTAEHLTPRRRDFSNYG